MPLILNIETATQICSVGLADEGSILAIRESMEKNVHAASVTVFTEEVLREAGKTLQDLDAVAVSMGPGSYTGLRIGVSAAKGFGYALDIPLIAIPTLQSMALGALSLVSSAEKALFCPMIDARRMEVYTALYDYHNREVRFAEALIINGDSYAGELSGNTIYYFGDGADKCRAILDPSGMIYIRNVFPSARTMAIIASEKFTEGQFEDIAYFEPYYLKDFIAGKPRVKGLQ